jgi:hypothetical protein
MGLTFKGWFLNPPLTVDLREGKVIGTCWERFAILLCDSMKTFEKRITLAKPIDYSSDNTQMRSIPRPCLLSEPKTLGVLS